MSERRVVVTGIGIISPVGNDLDTFWKNLTEGRSGLPNTRRSTRQRTIARLPARSQVLIRPSILGRPRMPGARIVCAIRDGGCQDGFGRLRHDLETVNHERFGVMVGSGIGGLKSMEEECRRLFDRGPSRVSPIPSP